jgi:hypothetical protein
MAGAMCLLPDLAVFAGSVATIFGLSWYQDTKRKRKIRKPIEEEKEEEQLHNKILAEQID